MISKRKVDEGECDKKNDNAERKKKKASRWNPIAPKESPSIELCLGGAPELCLYLHDPTNDPREMVDHIYRLLHYASAKGFPGSLNNPAKCNADRGYQLILMLSPSKGLKSLHLRLDLHTYFSLRKEVDSNDEVLANIREWAQRHIGEYHRLSQTISLSEETSAGEVCRRQRVPAPHVHEDLPPLEHGEEATPTTPRKAREDYTVSRSANKFWMDQFAKLNWHSPKTENFLCCYDAQTRPHIIFTGHDHELQQVAYNTYHDLPEKVKIELLEIQGVWHMWACRGTDPLWRVSD